MGCVAGAVEPFETFELDAALSGFSGTVLSGLVLERNSGSAQSLICASGRSVELSGFTVAATVVSPSEGATTGMTVGSVVVGADGMSVTTSSFGCEMGPASDALTSSDRAGDEEGRARFSGGRASPASLRKARRLGRRERAERRTPAVEGGDGVGGWGERGELRERGVGADMRRRECGGVLDVGVGADVVVRNARTTRREVGVEGRVRLTGGLGDGADDGVDGVRGVVAVTETIERFGRRTGVRVADCATCCAASSPVNSKAGGGGSGAGAGRRRRRRVIAS